MAAQDTVRKAYNEIANTYLVWVVRSTAQEEKSRLLLKYLDKNSRVLELGCGAGVPATKLLAPQVRHLLGVDISEKQIELARQNVPEAEFRVGDMTSLGFENASFDAVLSLFAIFHLPRAQHASIISEIHSWLKPGGLFLVNFTSEAMKNIQMEFLGATNFFSGWEPEESKKLVINAGFEIIDAEIRAQGDVGESDPDNGVSFFWVLARRDDAPT